MAIPGVTWTEVCSWIIDNIKTVDYHTNIITPYMHARSQYASRGKNRGFIRNIVVYVKRESVHMIQYHRNITANLLMVGFGILMKGHQKYTNINFSGVYSRRPSNWHYVIVISRCEYNILVIAWVRGGAEDECNNQDIVRAYPGYNWLLSHKPWQRICYLGNALSVYDIIRLATNHVRGLVQQYSTYVYVQCRAVQSRSSVASWWWRL